MKRYVLKATRPANLFRIASSGALAGLVACGASVTDTQRLTPESTALSVSPLLGLPITIPTSSIGVNLNLVASLAPPTVNSAAVQASDITLDGLNAYVGYNTANDSHNGAMDQINWTLPIAPSLSATVQFPNTDINGIAKIGTSVFAVGANSNNNPPAILYKANLAGGILGGLLGGVVSGAGLSSQTLSSYTATDAVSAAGKIWVTTGDTGGLASYDPTTLANSTSTSIADARSVAYAPLSGRIYVLSGQPGRVTVFNTSGVQQASYAVGGNTIAASKSTIQAGVTLLAVSLGDAGAAVLCAADGGVMATIPPASAAGLSAAETVTNAVAISGGLLFTADGGAGVRIFSLQRNLTASGTACGLGMDVAAVGSINVGNVSVNNLAYSLGSLVLATGTGGFKIVTVATLGTLLNAVTDFD